MNKEELLQSYSNGYDKLTAAIRHANSEMLYFKPAENKWSAVEVIIHLSDAECNANVRFRKAIAESGSNIDVFDHDAWAKLIDYQHQDVVTALALIQILRLNNFKTLSTLKDEIWSNYVIHPERGKVTLLELLNIYTEHIYVHIRQIQRNFDAYKNQTEL
jgi:hypothetical protein